MKCLAIFLICVVLLDPASSVMWKVITSPVGWFRRSVVDKPFRMGAAVRGFLTDTRSKDNKPIPEHQFLIAASKYIPGPTINQYVNDAVKSSVANQLHKAQTNSLLANLGQMISPQIDFEENATFNASGSEINLNDYLGAGTMFSPIPEIAAAKLEGFLKPVMEAASQHRDYDPEGESFETVLIDRFANLPEGEHVFDGNSIVLNIKPRTGNSTKVKVAYVDLSELKPYLHNQIITIFTGLGNTSGVLPFGLPINYDDYKPAQVEPVSTSTEIPFLPLTDYPYLDSEVEESNVQDQEVPKLKDELDGTIHSKEETKPERIDPIVVETLSQEPEIKELETNVESISQEPEITELNTTQVESIVKKQDEVLSQEQEDSQPKKSRKTFAQKLASAANIESVETEPEMMTIYSYQPDTVPDYIANRYGRVVVRGRNHNVTEDAKPRSTLEPVVVPLSDETASVPHPPRVAKLQPVYKPTPSPSPVFTYDPLAPRPVFHSPVPSTTTTVKPDIPEVDGDEDMRKAILLHVQGGIEGYLSHLKINHDQKNCVSLMACEIGAMPDRYGDHGRQVVKFFRDRQFPEKDVASNWYQSVVKLGDSVRTIPMCRSSFRNCVLNTQLLIELGRGLMFDIILS